MNRPVDLYEVICGAELTLGYEHEPIVCLRHAKHTGRHKMIWPNEETIIDWAPKVAYNREPEYAMELLLKGYRA